MRGNVSCVKLERKCVELVVIEEEGWGMAF